MLNVVNYFGVINIFVNFYHDTLKRFSASKNYIQSWPRRNQRPYYIHENDKNHLLFQQLVQLGAVLKLVSELLVDPIKSRLIKLS